MAAFLALVALSGWGASPGLASDFIKVKEYDDEACTEDPSRIQVALYPVSTCLVIGKARMRFEEGNGSLLAYPPPESYGGPGCLGAPTFDEEVDVGGDECITIGPNLHIKVTGLFKEGTYELSADENVVNAFTVRCSDPDMTGFNYYGLYRSGFCYSFELEGASEYFEVERSGNTTKVKGSIPARSIASWADFSLFLVLDREDGLQVPRLRGARNSNRVHRWGVCHGTLCVHGRPQHSRHLR